VFEPNAPLRGCVQPDQQFQQCAFAAPAFADNPGDKPFGKHSVHILQYRIRFLRLVRKPHILGGQLHSVHRIALRHACVRRKIDDLPDPARRSLCLTDLRDGRRDTGDRHYDVIQKLDNRYKVAEGSVAPHDKISANAESD
jgi:hypothetical protein